MDTTAIAFIASILALLAGVVFYRRVVAAPTTNERANEIAAAIATGASAFLRRQYTPWPSWACRS